MGMVPAQDGKTTLKPGRTQQATADPVRISFLAECEEFIMN
jgi:hypothetical protein